MLVDTSVLIRLLQPHHSLYPVADEAIRLLPERGTELHVVAQNLIELWVVSTRPLGENGLGITPAAAAVELDRIQRIFVFLPETPEIYPAWEALVTQHRVTGKPSHDARLVAAMKVHGLKAILTFDRQGSRVFPESRDPPRRSNGRQPVQGFSKPLC